MFKFANFMAKTVSIVVGLMFLIIGSIFFLKFDPEAYDMQGTGTVTAIEERYEHVGEDNQLVHDAFIDYTVDGKTYEHVGFNYNNKMKVGDTVEFYYMSEDPSQIAGSDKNLVPYIGLGCAVIGLVMLVVTAVKIIRRKPM